MPDGRLRAAGAGRDTRGLRGGTDAVHSASGGGPRGIGRRTSSPSSSAVCAELGPDDDYDARAWLSKLAAIAGRDDAFALTCDSGGRNGVVNRALDEQLGKMLAFCIAGHHAGLANGVNGVRTTALDDRLNEPVPAPDPTWEQEIVLPGTLRPPRLRPRDRNAAGFCAAFFIRMLFSALVDADYLDIEAYFAGSEGEPKPRGQHPALGELTVRLNAHLEKLAAAAEANPINELRQEILGHARRRAAEPPGLFSMTVPTGGGKTLTSLAFALEHALRHRLALVIYVIPYMSIIEQTAAVFREALRKDEADEPASRGRGLKLLERAGVPVAIMSPPSRGRGLKRPARLDRAARLGGRPHRGGEADRFLG